MRRRSRLIATGLAVIVLVLGVSLWFAVTRGIIVGILKYIETKSVSYNTALTLAIAFLAVVAAFLTAVATGIAPLLVSIYESKKKQNETEKGASDEKNKRDIYNCIQALKRDMEEISFKMNNSDKINMDLSIDYIPLRKTRDDDRHMQSNNTAVIQKQSDVSTFIQMEQKRLLSRVGFDMESSTKRWLLLGGPGAGKSVYLKYKALELLKNMPTDDALHNDELFDLPIYVECKEFEHFLRSTRHKGSIYEFIAFTWQKKYLPQEDALVVDVLADYIKGKVKKEKVWFLLDGLDEAPLWDKKQSSESYNIHLKLLIRSIPSSSQIPVIVTLRGPLYTTKDDTGFVDLTKQSPQFTSLTLEDFAPYDMSKFVDNQKDQYIKRHMRATDIATREAEAEKVRRAGDLKTILENNYRLQAFTATPLALQFIDFFSVKYEMSLFHAWQVDICKRYVNFMFTTWNKAKNISLDEKRKKQERHEIHACRLPIAEQQYALGHLASYLHEETTVMCKEEDMLREIAKIKKKLHSIKNDDALREKDIFMEIRLKVGFIKEDIEKRGFYRFTNIALQEYFVALSIIGSIKNANGANRKEKEENLLNKLKESWEWWEEIILLYIQQAGEDATELLETLAGISHNQSSLAQPKDEFCMKLLLAGRGLARSLQKQTKKTQHEIKMRLYCLLLSENSLFIQEQVVRVFVEMGQPSVYKSDLDLLKQWLAGQNGYDDVKKVVDEILAYMNNRDPAENIKPLSFLLLRSLHEIPLSQTQQCQSIMDYESQTIIEEKKKILQDKSLGVPIRVRMIYTLIAQERYALADILCELLVDNSIDIEVRACSAYALGMLGNQSSVEKLLEQLRKPNINLSIGWNIVTALGEIANRTLDHASLPAQPGTSAFSIADELLRCLNGNDPNATSLYIKDQYLRWNIATTLIYTLHEDRTKVYATLNLADFTGSVALSGIAVLKNADNVKEIQALFAAFSPGSPDSREHYIWICQILEKLRIDTKMLSKWKTHCSPKPSERELVDALNHLEWTTARKSTKL